LVYQTVCSTKQFVLPNNYVMLREVRFG
jgi:hypothetical protein